MTMTTKPVRRRRGQWRPVLGLAVLAPFCAEYLIGSISIRELVALPFLIPLYGAAALLIREAGRRSGGLPTMLLLAAAFGVFQAGIVDGSLFNRNFAGMELAGAMVPGLEFSAVFGLAFVVNHVMISMGAPIVLVETLTPGARETPWLGRTGLAAVAVAYLGGSLMIGWDTRQQEGFYPSPVQLTAAALTVAGLIVVALALPWRGGSPERPGSQPATAPRPRWVAVAIALLTGGYLFVPATWPGFALGVALVMVTAALVLGWSRRAGWRQPHRVAVAAGALFTAAWGAFIVGWYLEQTDVVTQVGHVAFAVVGAGLLCWAVRAGFQSGCNVSSNHRPGDDAPDCAP